MNKHHLIFLISALLFFLPASRLAANSFFMGRVLTVHAYGALDTVRNPALLSCQRHNNALGILANYQTSFQSKVFMRLAQLALIRPKVDTFDLGVGRISYARKIDHFSLGFDIYTNYESSGIKTRTIAMKDFPAIGTGTSITDKMTYEVSSSLAYAINANHSVGIGLNGKYYDSVETTKNRALIDITPGVYSHEFERETIREISSNPRIGYLAKLRQSEIGFILSPGRFVWKKNILQAEKYIMSEIAAMTRLEFKAKGELPYTFTYDVGPILIAGAYSRPINDIAMAIELEFSVPVTFTQPFLIQDETLYPPLSQIMYFKSSSIGKKQTQSTRPSVSIKGGFEFYVSRTTVFTLGGGIGYNDSKARIYGTFPDLLDKSYIYNYSFILYGMAGIDFLIGKESIITIGTVITHARAGMENTFAQFFATMGRELHILNFKIRAINADIILATSFGF
ncbi:MAG: hypothetical protein JW807_10470 [Spirochaetes bacterium]|nr:hypothetical protein [Spirochaetota bacterium]